MKTKKGTKKPKESEYTRHFDVSAPHQSHYQLQPVGQERKSQPNIRDRSSLKKEKDYHFCFLLGKVLRWNLVNRLFSLTSILDGNL